MNDEQVTIRSGQGAESHTQTFKLKDMPSEKATQNTLGLMAWLDLDPKELSKSYSVFLENENEFKFIPKDQGASLKPHSILLSRLGPQFLDLGVYELTPSPPPAIAHAAGPPAILALHPASWRRPGAFHRRSRTAG